MGVTSGVAVNTVNGSLAKALVLAKSTLPLHFRGFVNEVSEVMVHEVRERTPVSEPEPGERFSSGELLESIETLPTRHLPGVGLWRGGCKSGLKYASYVEDDTKEHPIDGKGNKLLVFHVERKHKTGLPGLIKTASVWHHGTTGQHMFLRGAVATENWVDRWGDHAMKVWITESRL